MFPDAKARGGVLLLLAHLLAALQCVCAIYPASVLQVQLNENLIAQHNDTDYVRKIMRLSKAAEMRNYMRAEVDACDNFYEYACGNWRQIYPAESSAKRKTSLFDLLAASYRQKQLRLLKEGRQENDTEAVQKVKDFYESCLRFSSETMQHYRQSLKEIIADFGGMPALLAEGKEWPDEEDFDWLDTIGRIQNRYGLNVILQLVVQPDFEDPSTNALFVGQPELALGSRSMYFGEATERHRKQYKQQIQHNLEVHLGVAAVKAASTADEILAFETKLSRGVPDLKTGKPTVRRSEAIRRTTEELQTIYGPQMDLLRFLKTALGHEPNATCYEYQADYQRNLAAIVNETSKAQLANYIMYQMAETFFVDTEPRITVREEICVDTSRQYFDQLLDNMVFRNYNSEVLHQDLQLIWLRLKEEFQTLLESERAEWLSSMTRKLAAERLAAMRLEVNSYANRNFSKDYKDLAITGSDYVANIGALLVHNATRFRQRLNEKPEADLLAEQLSSTPVHVGTENVVLIPVSLLQPNYLWSDYYPQTLKFGTLGFLLARELVHGLDGRGSDSASWWDEASIAELKQRQSCLKRQYGRYRYEGKYLAESELQAENVADNAGIQLAYAAYLNWLRAHEEEEALESLPHMDYTNRQLFFLSFGQFFCNDVAANFRDKGSLLDLNTPPPVRVGGSLANFDEFSKEFQCAAGTPLNPDKKCQIF